MYKIDLKDSTRLLIRSLTVITRMSGLWPRKGSGPGGGRTRGCHGFQSGSRVVLVKKIFNEVDARRFATYTLVHWAVTVQTGFEPASRRYERCIPARQLKIFQSVRFFKVFFLDWKSTRMWLDFVLLLYPLSYSAVTNRGRSWTCDL